MDKLRFEKLMAAWNEFGALLLKIEDTGTFTRLDRDVLKGKLTEVYENLLLDAGGPGIQSDNLGESKPATPIDTFHPDLAPLQPTSTLEEMLPAPETPGLEKPAETSKPPVLKRMASGEESAPYPAPDTTPVQAKETLGTGSKMPGVIGETLRSTRKLMHDELAEKAFSGKKDLTSSLQSKPIENIEKAIGINDKFLFIKELFRNNGQLYKETVEMLNGMQSQEEAMKQIHNRFDWDPSDPIVQKFIELVKRRHQ